MDPWGGERGKSAAAVLMSTFSTFCVYMYSRRKKPRAGENNLFMIASGCAFAKEECEKGNITGVLSPQAAGRPGAS